MILNYLKGLGISLGGLLVTMFFVTLLNYYNIINESILSILQIVIPTIWLFVGGFLIGRSSNDKGYLEGIKFGSIAVILFLLISLLGIGAKFEIKSIIYYLILIVSSMIGSIIGINKKVAS